MSDIPTDNCPFCCVKLLLQYMNIDTLKLSCDNDKCSFNYYVSRHVSDSKIRNYSFHLPDLNISVFNHVSKKITFITDFTEDFDVNHQIEHPLVSWDLTSIDKIKEKAELLQVFR